MAKAGEIEIGGVRLTSPDKVLYPEQAITKRALAEYYLAVAPAMLPHVARRPITLVRCPTGRQKKCFYQRHAGSGVPSELGEVDIPGFEESGAYLYIKDAKGLVALVQMGVLEVHPWGARIDRPDRPDRIIFDLDPGEGLGFPDVAEAALEVRAFLADLGLESFPKTTGGKGVHVVVPINRRCDYTKAKAFAKAAAEALAARTPTRYLTRVSKAERRGRIFIDYLRNDATATAVAPYSTRSRAGAPVATPLTWEELTPTLDPAALNVETVPGRLQRIGGDPWREMGKVRQGLPASFPA
ncbi:MAG TPA: non-homologous end-joining DNA ligase [Beijerinckiaceae bacterium]